MAIRIDKGTVPPLGRITAPQGTFLNSPQAPFSSPSTAADGALGQFGSGNPVGPQPSVPVGGNPSPYQTAPTPASSVAPAQASTFWQDLSMMFWGPQNPAKAEGDFFREWLFNEGRFSDNPDAFRDRKAQPTTNAFSSTSNPLVGANISSTPMTISNVQTSTMFPNLTPEQIRQTMTQKGYFYQVVPGQGGMWVRDANAATEAARNSAATPGSASTPQVDERGRVQWVDPTSLARGERVTTQSGTTFVGGTPTADGKAQYAVTYGGGVDDEKFKWREQTTQDDDGNWVKVYSRELRKVYTRSHRRKQQARREQMETDQAAAVQEQPSTKVEAPIEYQTLVNFRADYG